ncbi:Fic family protein [Clostridium sp. Cult2]|nr:hypothetical protein [Clostridium sp. Cult2]
MQAISGSEGIINNHPFIDGNKWIGLLAMFVFLEVNGIVIMCRVKN